MPKRKRSSRAEAEPTLQEAPKQHGDPDESASKRKRSEEPEQESKPSGPSGPSDHQSDDKNGAKKTEAENNATRFEVPVEGKKPIHCERYKPQTTTPNNTLNLIFTHGAGGNLTTPAIADFATGFSRTSPLTLFQGNLNLKSRVAGFQSVIAHQTGDEGDTSKDLALGGRSMGARAACMAVQQVSQSGGKVDALVLVSFPLVGAAKSDSREQTLLDLPGETDVLIVAGSEDSMCPPPQLLEVVSKMEATVWLVEVEGADHGMAVKATGGKGTVASKAMRERKGEVAAAWLRERDGAKRSMMLSWDEEEGKVVSDGWREADVDESGAPVNREEAEDSMVK